MTILYEEHRCDGTLSKSDFGVWLFRWKFGVCHGVYAYRLAPSLPEDKEKEKMEGEVEEDDKKNNWWR